MQISTIAGVFKIISNKTAQSMSLIFAVLLFVIPTQNLHAAEYVIDTKGAHAFVQFRIKHLGFSWLYGRFNKFEGKFYYDPQNLDATKVSVEVDVSSVDSNHARRDAHLIRKKYLNVKKFPKASFTSTSYKQVEKGKGILSGNLTFMGVTKPLVINVEHIGGGTDLWGGYREGFEGRATMTAKDWGLDLAKKLGKESATVELMLSVEGIRKRNLRKKR